MRSERAVACRRTPAPATVPAGALAAALVLAALATSGCHDEQSFIVVTVQSGTTEPINGVADLVVTVTNGGSSTSLTYQDTAPYTITGKADPVTGKVGKTLAVAFSSDRASEVKLDITARDTGKCPIATGQTTTQIKRNGVNTATVALVVPTVPLPCIQPDAGGAPDAAPDGAPDVAMPFTGCDPTAAATCGAGMTCAVDCTLQKGECVAAGTGAPGTICSQNVDCTQGTQCFLYGGAGTVGCGTDAGGTTGACLKFCNSDSDCGGGGSLCRGAVTCPNGTTSSPTAYHTCTFGCDPRGAATLGCPSGLRCFVVDTMDQVDCACTETTRTQQEGQDCDHTQRLDCAPGLICNLMGGTQRCRKVCKRSENGADCSAGQVCEILTNDLVYGACL